MSWTRDLGWVVLLLVVVAWIGGLLIGDDAYVPPIRRCEYRDMPPALVDVLSRLPESDAKAANHDGDLITWAHEGTHFLNSRLSKPGTRGFYMLDGLAWYLPVPKNTRLAHVAEAVPKEYRGKTYRTYLIDAQRDWGDIALYPFDEAIAYWHGAVVRHERGQQDRQETERFGVELLVYCKYVVQEVERRDPTYPIEELRDFYNLLVARARMICPSFDSQPYAVALGDDGRDLFDLAMRDRSEVQADVQAAD